MFVLLAVFAFLINIPFGRLRSKVKKFSWRWFAYIHIPIPFIALPRILLGISYYFIPLFLVASVAGQIAGSRLKPGAQKA
ncbi:hypothetical protein DESAMIL20_1167 [Desulfurella amilsii]|uniref:Uncharacterized protein n=1 Tax=Desulfurella amilsii TaxID=1562698 RepID=A0A1X4XVS1_9BACT|nr:hypothetical protein [Desulfurella amilsii]OSS41614.1 hypothetical protein DESAMIL20_1167 [Desulfurella amilsii]